MRIVNKKSFFRGSGLLISFAILLALILCPLLPGEDGEKITGLEYADQIFNELSKGSSNFMKLARETARSMDGRQVYLVSPLNSEYQAELARTLLSDAGVPQLKVDGDRLAFRGNLGAILEAAVNDSELLFHNDGAAVSSRYGGTAPLDVSNTWWRLLDPCIRELQKEKKLEEANAVDLVIRKAIEPANNFYGIPAKKVSENLLLLCALLLFYVGYTIWYGFGIYEIFEGLGLMEKNEGKAAEEAESA